MTQPPAPPALLDTNVASFIFTARKEAALYEHDLRGRRRMIAFQTEAELLAGADIRGWTGRRRALLTRFLKDITTIYPTQATSRAYAHLHAALIKAGEPLQTADLWIAATSLATGITLVAHDAAFRRVAGLHLICRAPE